MAKREPVSITDRGRDSLVLLSADEFERLKALDARKAFYAWELPDDLAAAPNGARESPPSRRNFGAPHLPRTRRKYEKLVTEIALAARASACLFWRGHDIGPKSV